MNTVSQSINMEMLMLKSEIKTQKSNIYLLEQANFNLKKNIKIQVCTNKTSSLLIFKY